jgi:hypothetical protein
VKTDSAVFADTLIVQLPPQHMEEIHRRPDAALSRSKHGPCGSELAREKAGTSAESSWGKNEGFASKVERHPGHPHSHPSVNAFAEWRCLMSARLPANAICL